MNYNELGFRPFYKNFSILLNNDNIMDIVADLDVEEVFDGVLVYGYVDHEAGFTFEILSIAQQEDDGSFKFFDLPNDITYKLRADAVKECECLFSEDVFDEYLEIFKDKISSLETYEENENVSKSRRFDFLDSFRHEECIDDVQVVLLKEGLQPEQVWVRIEDLGDKVIIGKLLNEPAQDFGYHLNEKVAFFVYTDEDDNQHLLCDMNPSLKLKAEDLADGSMLREAIAAFNDDKTESNFIDVLELLRDSLVWIPCNVVMGEADKKFLEELAEKDEEEIVGKTFSALDDIRMIPDILKNGDNHYFPVFSNREQMGDYGNDFSKVQKHFFEAMNLAMGNDADVVGIVVDAFSNPIVIDKGLFDIIGDMKSRLVEK